jgi:integrase
LQKAQVTSIAITTAKFSLLSERKREQVLDESQEASYLAVAKEPCRTIAVIWIELGMRPGEIVRLRPEDLDWMMLQIHVRAGKSPAARRTLPTPNSANDRSCL